MKLTIKSARQPRWANPEHTAINLYVLFKEHEDGLGELPFTAVPNDVAEHGRLLFALASAGKYGAVEPFEEQAINGYIKEHN